MKSLLPNKAHDEPTRIVENNVVKSNFTVKPTDENFSVKFCQFSLKSTIPVRAEMAMVIRTEKKLYERHPASESNSPFRDDETPSTLAILSAINPGAASRISDKYFSITKPPLQ